jgi:serine/threonine protein kinase
MPSRYMAPEVILASKTADKSYGKKADVYSFGILMWHLWTLKRPFDDYHDYKTFQDLLLKDVSSGRARPKPARPWRCPRWLCDLMAACWEDSPADRPDFTAIVVMAQLCSHSVLDKTCNHRRAAMPGLCTCLSVAEASLYSLYEFYALLTYLMGVAGG